MFIKTVCILAITIGFMSGGILAQSYFATANTPTIITTSVPVTPLPPYSATTSNPNLTETSPKPSAHDAPLPPPTPVALFGTAVTMQIDQSLTFPDNLVVTLGAISDSRCKPDVQCIWAGELAPTLTLSGGALDTREQTVGLGSSRTPKATLDDYTLTLVSATEHSIVLLVEKNLFVSTTIPSPKPTRTLQAVATKPVVPTLTTSTTSDFAADISRLIKEKTTTLRTKKSLPAYAPDATLSASARLYSNQLMLGNLLAHIDTNGCTLTCRFTKSGYQAQAWGENLARMEFTEQPTAEYVANFFMTQWQKSAGHLENILSPVFTEQGIGISFDDNSVYVVVHFAHPKEPL